MEQRIEGAKELKERLEFWRQKISNGDIVPRAILKLIPRWEASIERTEIAFGVII
jgi:hypothetical protein